MMIPNSSVLDCGDKGGFGRELARKQLNYTTCARQNLVTLLSQNSKHWMWMDFKQKQLETRVDECR